MSLYHSNQLGLTIRRSSWIVLIQGRMLIPTPLGMLGDWFAAWTVMADFLGPETMVFSLHEGDSADGR
jgi:hypothetical protein